MKPPLPPLDPGEGPCVAADATASPETDAAAIAPFSGELRFFRTGLGGIQTCVLGPEKDSSSYYYRVGGFKLERRALLGGASMPGHLCVSKE